MGLGSLVSSGNGSALADDVSAVVDWLKGELAGEDPSKSVIAQNVDLIRRASVLREVKR